MHTLSAEHDSVCPEWCSSLSETIPRWHSSFLGGVKDVRTDIVLVGGHELDLGLLVVLQVGTFALLDLQLVVVCVMMNIYANLLAC